MNENANKSLEAWIWDAACSIRGAKDAPKYKDYILPLIFTKRLCDVFDDELNRIAAEVGSRAKAFQLVQLDKSLVRFYLPLEPQEPQFPVWSVIRELSDQIGEQLTSHLRAIARENPSLQGIIDRVDFNATTHGQRDLEDNRLSNLIEAISMKRLGLKDVEPDIIGRSYEYLIRKFAEGSGQSAGEFYTPKEVGFIMAHIMNPEPGMTVYDPCCGSAGLLIKCQLALEEQMKLRSRTTYAPLKLYGQEYVPDTWAMANMNMIIHDMEGVIEIGDAFRNPKFRQANRLHTFQRVVANPMWNQTWFTEKDYDADELDRFPQGAGYPGNKADWGWVQHILASLNDKGRAAIVLDTGAASRGSGNAASNKEKEVRKWFIERDLVEGVIYHVVRKAYSKKVYVDKDFQRKTSALVREHIGAYGVQDVAEVFEINEASIELIKQAKGGDTAKVINLVKSIERIAEEQSGDPFLIAIADRAKAIQENFENRQHSTTEALQELFSELERDQQRKREQAQKGFDGLTFFVYRSLQEAGIDHVDDVSRKISAAFSEHSNWAHSEKAMREVRKRVTFAVYAVLDDLERVTQIVDSQFTLLQKACE